MKENDGIHPLKLVITPILFEVYVVNVKNIDARRVVVHL